MFPNYPFSTQLP